MANLQVKDATGSTKYIKTSGAGSDGDPHIPEHVIGAAEVHIGEVGNNSAVVAFTLSLDTNIYASGDVLAEAQEVASALRVANGEAILESVILNDKNDQGQALDLVFLSANVSLGAENSAVSISDANADNILGVVQVSAIDWVDLGGCRVATKSNIGLVLTSVSGSTSIYIGAISRGTGTYTASGITGRLGLLRD